MHLPNDSHGERGGKGPHRPPGKHQEALQGGGHVEGPGDEGCLAGAGSNGIELLVMEDGGGPASVVKSSSIKGAYG